MRFHLFLALLAVLGCEAAFAQSPIQPGQLLTSEHAMETLHSASLIPNARALSLLPAAQDRHDQVMNRLWMTSIAAMVGATAADAATSWGKWEGNSLLASSDGTFGARGLTFKAGMAAA